MKKIHGDLVRRNEEKDSICNSNLDHHVDRFKIRDKNRGCYRTNR